MHLHTHFPRGAHLFVILRDGRKFDDKFWPSDKRGYVRLQKHGHIALSEIRSLSYYRNPTPQTTHKGPRNAP
jgi:hypothetical protein